jgi:peptidoglycan hydrolase-like protein with peptidoglycan-binding domain
MDPNLTTNARDVDISALLPGAKIGRFEVISVLGQGGFGITYRARDTQLGREVAIKEYLPTSLAYRDAGATVLPRSTKVAEDFTWGCKRFVDEGRTLATLHETPGIVKVFDFLEINGTAYIVMEMLHGETLEGHIRKKGPLGSEVIERIVWPLLDGLEQVHAAGFLHRDIKPANILLNANGHPTLIDFGASRAAMAGRSVALTAIFTPGYAAAEQMTSAKQGPWTDIYGLSATLYHAITGQTPPSAFDRMLDDTYQPLGKKVLPGFARGLLTGIDAGLAVRANDRPQSIADWRPILGRFAALAGDTMVMLVPPSAVPPPAVVESVAAKAASPPRMRGIGLWIGAAAVVIVVLAVGYYALVGDKRAAAPQVAAVGVPSAVDKAAQDAQLAAEAQRLKDQEELARLRTEAAAREKAEQEAAQRKQIEEETRRKIEADMAEKQRQLDDARQKAAVEAAEKKRLDDEGRLKAEADAAAKRKAEQDEQKATEASENALRLTVLDRQHVQIALSALGFNTGGTDGAFGTHTRDMIAAWQKARNNPSTGFLTGVQNQALLKDAAPAIARYAADQKKIEEDKKKAEEETKAKAAAAAPAMTQTPAKGAQAPTEFDGLWSVTYLCPPHKTAIALSERYNLVVKNGYARGQFGTEGRPNSKTVLGQIQLDGSAQIVVSGMTGNPIGTVGNLQEGTPFSWTFQANFAGKKGIGYRTTDRPCTFTFVKQ